MLRSVKELKGYGLAARDGAIGKCKDFLFDDEHWTVRYMTAETGKWIPGREVLISPISLGKPDWNAQVFPVRLYKKDIEEAPGLKEDAPVSRQFEITFNAHYGWPQYWGGAEAWGPAALPSALYDQKIAENPNLESGDSHLRSVDHVSGYHIKAQDGEIGHVEDFIVEDDTWTIRYIVLNTRNWLPGKSVLLSPMWITSIDWKNRDVAIELTKEGIKDSPEYDPSAPINREYETNLYDFHGRPQYWQTK